MANVKGISQWSAEYPRPNKDAQGRKMRKPWTDRKVKTAIRKKARLYARMKKIRKESDIRRYRHCKEATQSLERQTCYSNINNIIEFDEENDSKPNRRNASGLTLYLSGRIIQEVYLSKTKAVYSMLPRKKPTFRIANTNQPHTWRR